MLEQLCIRNCNLIIPNALLPPQIQSQDSILITYDDKKNAILISGPRHIGFKLSYPMAHQQIMKIRNMEGDRVIACHALFLDHSLADESNEDVTLKTLQDGNVIQINLSNHSTTT